MSLTEQQKEWESLSRQLKYAECIPKREKKTSFHHSTLKSVNVSFLCTIGSARLHIYSEAGVSPDKTKLDTGILEREKRNAMNPETSFRTDDRVFFCAAILRENYPTKKYTNSNLQKRVICSKDITKKHRRPRNRISSL